jgi:osmotically-inducible protein OsmY
MERFSQTKRVEAALMELDLQPLGARVEVIEKGIVHISGLIYKHEDTERIEKVIRGIPGVERVEMDVMVMPAATV